MRRLEKRTYLSEWSACVDGLWNLCTLTPLRGLAGMTARAEQMGAQLRTGVDDDYWLVDLILPSVEQSATPAVTT